MRRLMLLALIVLLAGGGFALWCRQRVITPYRGFASDELFVDLPPGSSLSSISSRLADAGVIPDPWTFRVAARVTGADRRLKAGEYRFAEASSPSAVMARLVAGDRKRPVGSHVGRRPRRPARRTPAPVGR